jgi:23S rRNA pseudouridine2457 synthase
MLLAFNKPYGVLCQFTDQTVPPRPTLAGFTLPPGVYAAGRLDQDSEGLLLLSDDGPLIARISSPKFHWPKAQVLVGAPDWLWPRDPPVRARKTVPDSWIELTITEGRNRQVRRMTAAVGLPTLRLLRIAVGPHRLEGLPPGQWRELVQ